MSNYPTRAGVEDAEPLEFPTKRLSISTTVHYRARVFTVSAEGYTMDRLCDMLDEKFGPAQAAPNGANTPAATASPPLCPVHNRPMKEMKFPSRQGYQFHCTTKVADGWCDERA